MLKTDYQRRSTIFNSFVQKAASKAEEGEEETEEYNEDVYYNKEGELEINKENRSQAEVDSDEELEKE